MSGAICRGKSLLHSSKNNVEFVFKSSLLTVGYLGIGGKIARHFLRDPIKPALNAARKCTEY
jgi:1-acyl-sn-glycerol-3-phosphate acyltransferase